MKKRLNILTVAVITIISLFGITLNISNAAPAQAPIYDAGFNNGVGAFFANGTPITISEINGVTTVSWNGNSQAIAPTTFIFGGGREGTSYDSSSIILNSGNVSEIYGGGFSTNGNNPAIVGVSNITTNGGNVSNSIFGGGLLYSQVSNANITVNGGSATFLVGGGEAFDVIDGVQYSTGTAENPMDSGTIVRNARIVINNGDINYVFGGGQSYSNTGSVNLIVNDGEFDYIVAGGSNGYTGTSRVTINGGNTSVYQSTNRGIVDNVIVRVNGGTITDFYVGGENDPTVTGILNNANIRILGGRVTNLNPGTSNGVELDTTLPQYDIVVSDDAVENNNLPPDSFENINDIVFWIIVILIAFLALFFIFRLFF